MWPRFIPLPGTMVLIVIFGALAITLSNLKTREKAETISSTNTPTQTQIETVDQDTFQRSFKPDVFYVAITERPLFSPERRPQLPIPEEEIVEIETPVALETVNEPVYDFRLHGTMITDGLQSALISIDDTPAEWIRENGLISGWNLSDITPEIVELHKGSEVILIYLYEDGR